MWYFVDYDAVPKTNDYVKQLHPEKGENTVDNLMFPHFGVTTVSQLLSYTATEISLNESL